MNHLPLIIKREYLTKVKNKAFIVMTVLSPLILIALIAAVAYLTQLNQNEKKTINIFDETGFVTDLFEDSELISYRNLENMSLKDAISLTKVEDNYGLLYIKESQDSAKIAEVVTFYSQDSPSLGVISNLENKVEQRLTNLNLERVGVDLAKIESAKVSIDISQESFDGETSSKFDNILKLAFGGLSGYLLFMFIIIYGNMIMRSVIEEKTSRIIEVIISSVKPIQLMMGKIIGTSLAGITQFVIWIILGTVAIFILSMIFGIDVTELRTPQREMMEQAMQDPQMQGQIENAMTAFLNLPLLNLVLAFIGFFLGGYLLYSSMYAAIGAAVDNETDTQQFMMPIIMPLILAVYVGAFTVIEDPHGTVSVVFSFIPLTSPVVMLMRIPFGVPVWQQLLSLTILLGTFMLTVWFAAKIYRVGILMYGKKPTYKELFKWLKY